MVYCSQKVSSQRLDRYASDSSLLVEPAPVEVTLFAGGRGRRRHCRLNSCSAPFLVDPHDAELHAPSAAPGCSRGSDPGGQPRSVALLSAIAGWSIDEIGYDLSDAAGGVRFPCCTAADHGLVTAADVEALGDELASLQAQIQQAGGD